MSKIINVIKGTKDILPQNISDWHRLEETALEIFTKYGYKEIRTPIFEATELFARGVGDTTDIVNKEMYTFEKSDRSLTLRPENTAGVVRSFIENGMARLSAPVKLWYHGPMFRYERPQAGRQRQFHQVGVEMFGIKQPTADAEVILLAVNYLKALGLNDLLVEINSLGCPTCREAYKKRIKEVLKPEFDNLCEDCQSRYEKNPLRLLDCKVDSCKEIFEKPEIKKVIQSDFICEDCAEHFKELKTYLDKLGVKYVENKLLVRGLDYYTKTAFEIKYPPLGAQSAVAGGGRYDGLSEEMGGNPTPAVGFATGLERLLLALESQNLLPEKNRSVDAYVVALGEKAQAEGFKLLNSLRQQGLSAAMDFAGRSMKAQMKQANKMGAKYSVILGEDEISEGVVMLRSMEDSSQAKVPMNQVAEKIKV